MDANQLEQINEIIKKSLPAQVGEVLRETLAQGEKNAKLVKEQESLINNFKEALVKYEKDVIELEAKIKDEDELVQREIALVEGIRELEIDRLKYQLESEKSKSEFVVSVTMGLVRNSEYRKKIFDTEITNGLPMLDANGTAHYPMPTSKSHTSEESIL